MTKPSAKKKSVSLTIYKYKKIRKGGAISTPIARAEIADIHAATGGTLTRLPATHPKA